MNQTLDKSQKHELSPRKPQNPIEQEVLKKATLHIVRLECKSVDEALLRARREVLSEIQQEVSKVLGDRMVA